MGSSLPEGAFPRAQEREEETQSGMLRSFISQWNPHQAARMASSEAWQGPGTVKFTEDGRLVPRGQERTVQK